MKLKKKVAIIAGAGPAGLTAAYELLDKTDIHPIIHEQSDAIGGISQTVFYKGNRMDIGGHRFFSKSQRVVDWWNNIMPLQGAPAKDDILICRDKEYANNGPNPEETSRVMLIRERVSRIYFLRKFFDYPISLKWKTFANMGLIRTIKAGIGYLISLVAKKKETSLENFYINRFGKPLYTMFFEDYTEKVWGIHPSKLGANWGAQRVKGLSVFAIIKDIFNKSFSRKQKEVETSLIESFIYPKFGPGQLWETVSQEIQDKGGQVLTGSRVKKIHVKNNIIDYVETESKNGSSEINECDYFLSSMPIKDLITAIDGIDIPMEVKKIANELPYRDFITVGLLVKQLKMSNETSIKTYKNRIPDTWIYIQERDVKIGRLQIFNNWSPYLVNDYENSIWIGLEYFCTEGDELWTMKRNEFVEMAINELVHIGIINKEDVIDSTQIKVKKAYPAYYGSYSELDKVIKFLDNIDNLFCIGRNGQHRYNNMDHSMMTAMEAVDHIKNGIVDKSSIWAVNTEEEYHESKK
jgi:protoporphyrinogen oxidase